MVELSIVLPCYNESGNIPGLLARYRAVARDIDLELILVDNGSTDDSPRVMAEALKDPANSFARSVRVPVNIGYGHGLQEGLKVTRAPVVGISHADLQCSPEDALVGLRLYREKSINGRCLIKGRRQGRRSTGDRIVTFFYNFLGHLLLGLRPADPGVVDINAEPKIFDRSLLPALVNGPHGFTFDAHILACASAKGWEIYEFVVSYQARAHGHSKLAANPWLRLKTSVKSLGWMLAWAIGRRPV